MLVDSRAVLLRVFCLLMLISPFLAGCGGGGHHRKPKVIPAPSALPIGANDELPVTPADPSRPNIVFILTDDLDANLIKYMPHVQDLRKRGMSFKKFIVSDSLCCPSRTSMFTGELPHNSRVFTNSKPDGGFYAFRKNNDDNKTFNLALFEHGYRTALAGKYLNGYAASSGGVPKGWTSWSGTGKGYHGFKYTLDENGQPVFYGERPTDYLTDVLAYQARRFVTEPLTGLLGGVVHDPRPFMLEVATFAPHLPAIPAPRDLGTYPDVKAPRGGAFGKRNTGALPWLQGHGPLTRRQLEFIDNAYGRRVRSVVAIDQLLGNLETQLRENGQLNNTYIFFGSDNGLHMGEHRLLPGKKSAFDTDIRVPLIVAGPGIRPGSETTALTQNTDLAPTFAQLGGAPISKTYDGRSLVPWLHGKRPRNWRRAALIEHRRTPFSQRDPDFQPPKAGNPPSYEALRLPDATYVEYHNGQHEYYDDKRDPAQLHNVYDALPAARKAQLYALIDRLRSCHGARQCSTG